MPDVFSRRIGGGRWMLVFKFISLIHVAIRPGGNNLCRMSSRKTLVAKSVLPAVEVSPAVATSSKNWVVILLFYLLWRFHLQWQDIIQDVGGDVIIFTYSGGFPSEQDITQDLGGDINMLNSSDGN